jgi:phasin
LWAGQHEAYSVLGMRPTSEAWSMSVKDRHGAPASTKIAAGVMPGHPRLAIIMSLEAAEIICSDRSVAMADTFMTPEVMSSVRDLMKMSIEQAKQAFETFAATSEKTWKSLETTSEKAGSGIRSLNEKMAQITRSNAEANFAIALKLAESKDLSEAMQLQADHARKQMETFAAQLEEIRDLAAKIIEDSGRMLSPER